MSKIAINTNIVADLKDFWTRKISIKNYFKNLFKDTTKHVSVVLIQNVILFASALLVILIIPYIAGNTFIPEFVRALLAGVIVILPFLVFYSFERIRNLVEGYYHGANTVISMIIILLMATFITYTMVNGDIKWANIVVCIVAVLGSIGLLVHVSIKYFKRNNQTNESN